MASSACSPPIASKSVMSLRVPRPTPLVCLPGLVGDPRIFDPLLAALGEERPVRALELPPGTPFEVARQVSWTLRAWTAGPAHVLTGSWGGLAALCLPPEQVASLAVVATLPSPRFYPGWMTPARRALTLLPPPLVEAAYRRHLARELAADGVPPELALAIVRRGLSRDLLLSRLRSARCRDIPRASAPTLWLAGSEDPQVSWTAHDLRESHPGVDSETVPGRHRPYASHPEALLERLRPFWSRHEPRPQGSPDYGQQVT
jgi:pimeloyl-ACP methyl ester carboxylesterase